MRKLVAAAVVLAFFPANAHAQVPSFNLVNHSGQNIVRLSLSPSSAESWGPDILRAVIAPGRSARVGVPQDGAACHFDIRIRYDNGETLDLRSVNLCETRSITVTNDEDEAGAEDDVLTG